MNKGAIEIDTEKCKGCNICVVSCPQDVISLSAEVNDKGYNFAFPEYHDKCTGCANCGVVCPDGVITVYRIKI